MLDTRGLVLGEIAVREKLLTREQLDECLAYQEGIRYASTLGEVMVKLGFVRPEYVTALLERQQQAIEGYEKLISVSGLFGRIAVQRGFVTEAQLAHCIRTQMRLEAEGQRRRIGWIMVREKLLTLEQFWEIISAQGPFLCGQCGHALDHPRFEQLVILCEKCGAASVRLDNP
jgi:hypothetical protein